MVEPAIKATARAARFIIGELCNSLSSLKSSSARWAQSSQNDANQPSNRRLGRQIARCGQSVQAVSRKFGGRDIIPDRACLYPLGQQVSDECVEPMLRPDDVLTS